MADKKDYICAVPFTSMEIHDRARFLCCASWLKKYLPEESSPVDAWNSTEANDIRDSILDGSYKHCDSLQCPMLHQLETVGPVAKIQPLYHKNNIPSQLQSKLDDYKNGTLTPTIIQFSFDRTCNLACPSCRVELFTASKKKITEVEATIQEIEDSYGNTTTTLYITGSGDPFISVGFRNFLRNFDKTKWPKLNNIHLHTNATKWNKKMWDSMPNIHRYVKSCEISIDAATKDTYENKTRLGGKWDELIENLKFISTIPSLVRIKPSFVVQQKNYKEMKMFYDLMASIFVTTKDLAVYYGKITNWKTFSDEAFKKEKVWDTNHPEFHEFVEEVNRTLPNNHAWSNLQEFITPSKKLI
jgi:organic radical activating enzyme|tara:strand:+ start:12 stop:1082 length:1071 start_codon:yes stop_codon:yes gene_type:complete